jgi:hypothetical protein
MIRTRTRNQYAGALCFVAGMAVGGRLMYLLDPVSGKRRRVSIRDKFVHVRHVAMHKFDKTLRDLRNRARGVLAETRASLGHQDTPDEILTERVRAKLGRIVSHPTSIEVIVSCGHVLLTGSIQEQEVKQLTQQVYSVRGVRGVRYVENKFQVNKETGTVAGPQDANSVRGVPTELMH